MNYFPSFVPCSPNNIGYRAALCGRAAGSLGDRANTGWVNDLSLADCRHFPLLPGGCDVCAEGIR